MRQSAALQAATVQQHCKPLRLPAIAAQCMCLAEQAVREKRTHLGYLESLLAAEWEERERNTVELVSKYLSMIFTHPSRTIPKKFSIWYS